MILRAPQEPLPPRRAQAARQPARWLASCALVLAFFLGVSGLSDMQHGQWEAGLEALGLQTGSDKAVRLASGNPPDRPLLLAERKASVVKNEGDKPGNEPFPQACAPSFVLPSSFAFPQQNKAALAFQLPSPRGLFCFARPPPSLG